MIDIKFKIGGREVGPNNLKDVLEKAIFQNVRSQIAQRVGNISCPEHGKSPQITAEGRDLSSLSFTVKGCCDKAVDEVRRRMGAK
jgi:hypothetical protein